MGAGRREVARIQVVSQIFKFPENPQDVKRKSTNAERILQMSTNLQLEDLIGTTRLSKKKFNRTVLFDISVPFYLYILSFNVPSIIMCLRFRIKVSYIVASCPCATKLGEWGREVSPIVN